MPRLAFLAIVCCGLSCGSGASNDDAADLSPSRFPLTASLASDSVVRLVQRNLDPSVSLPATLLQEKMDAWHRLPIGERVARWADLFRQRGDATYRFGLLEGGYVAEGLLVQDFKPDCVLFFYRCTDLARSRSPREAILRGLESRFAGAETAPVDSLGRVDYDDPAHLDYSLDILRSGIWGRDVTREVGVAIADSVGTSRYPAGSFDYIPSQSVRMDRLQDGDHVFFVLDENSERGRKLRQEYGLVVGHQGIAHRRGTSLSLIHAASKDLPGEYAGNRVVEVPLRTYLQRVETHKGILVLRVTDEAVADR
jgi:hypothetical protein